MRDYDMLVRFIGDVHGKIEGYQDILSLDPDMPTVQVGDMGIGFRNSGVNSIHKPHNKFIRGNHDSPQEFYRSVGAIPDGYYDRKAQTLYIGGAESIDKDRRIEGVSWWRDEQMSYAQWQNLFEQISWETSIKTVVTHDCPSSIAQELFGVKAMSLTGQALDHLWERLRLKSEVKTWIFGHWHESKDVTIRGTRFVCLAELEWKDIEV